MNQVSASDMLVPAPTETTKAGSKRIAQATGSGHSVDEAGIKLLREGAEAMKLTARSYANALAVASTIAQLDGRPKASRIHVVKRQHTINS